MLPSLSAPGTPFPELCGCMEMPQGIRDTATTTKGFQGVEGKVRISVPVLVGGPGSEFLACPQPREYTLGNRS